jgi:hypothetical protein
MRPIMLNLDTAILDQIITTARERVADDPRWLHAYEHGRPCWHRAAGRLVQRYDEADRTQQRAAKLARIEEEVSDWY